MPRDEREERDRIEQALKSKRTHLLLFPEALAQRRPRAGVGPKFLDGARGAGGDNEQ
jgi:hypothetical protein